MSYAYTEPTSALTSARLNYAEHKKSLMAAYVLWAMFGWLGGHRFYLKRPISASIMLVLSLTVIGLAVSVIWWLIDLFLIPFISENTNRDFRDYFGA